MSQQYITGQGRKQLQHVGPWLDVNEPQVIFSQGKRKCIDVDDFIYTPNGIVKVGQVYDGMPILGGYVREPYFFEDDVYEVTIDKIKFRANGEHPLFVFKKQYSRSDARPASWTTIQEIFDQYSKYPANANWFVEAYDGSNFEFNTVSIGKKTAKFLGTVLSDASTYDVQIIQIKDARIEENMKNLLVNKNSFGKLQLLEIEELREFVDGFFSTNGTVLIKPIPELRFRIGTNQDLAYEFQFMLWRLGISGNVETLEKTGSGFRHDVWEVAVNTKPSIKNLLAFLDDVRHHAELSQLTNNINQYYDFKTIRTAENNSEFLPITRIKKIGKKMVAGWKTIPSNEIISYRGLKTHNSGKGVAIDEIVYLLWQAGITIIHPWAARNNENWYYAMNKNCGAYWKDWREKHHEELRTKQIEEPLHCNCSSPLPISVMIPENVYNSMKHWQVDVFNGVNWKSRAEYDLAWNNNQIPSHQWVPDEPWADVRQLKKPDNLIDKSGFFPLIKLKKFTVPSPTSQAAQGKFWNDFVNIFLEARSERRIITANPMMMTGWDKFHTAAYMLNNMYKLTQKYCPPLDPEDVGVKTRDEMTIVQKSNHKVAMVFSEIKTLAPSQKLNPESGVGETKKALYNMIGEARHWQCWLIGDYQSPEDLFSGVKYQSDIYIIKRGTKRLLGEDWGHLFVEVEKERQKIFDRYQGINMKSIYLADKEWPEINHMPDNLGYIVIDDEITKLDTFYGASWHHKHTREQFTKDFKIDLPEEVLSNLKKELEEEGKSMEKAGTGRKKKQITDLVYKDLDYYMIKHPEMNYVTVKDKLVEDYDGDEGAADLLDYVKNIEADSLGQGYRRWKKKPVKK